MVEYKNKSSLPVISTYEEGKVMTDKELEDFALQLRRDIIELTYYSGTKSSHVGGELSAAEIMAVLYGHALKLKPEEPEWEDLLCVIHCLLEADSLLISDLAHYHYVVRKGSLSHKRFSEMVTNEISLVNEIREALKHTTIIDNLETMLDSRLKGQIAFFLKESCDKGYVVQYYELKDMTHLLGKKIVLYGAGVVGRDYYTQLSRDRRIDIVAWIDKCSEKHKLDFYEVQSVDYIKSVEFDIVLICVNNKIVAQKMISTLCDMGIDREKILWYKPERAF